MELAVNFHPCLRLANMLVSLNDYLISYYFSENRKVCLVEKYNGIQHSGSLQSRDKLFPAQWEPSVA